MAKEKRIIIPGLNLLTSMTDDWGGENNTGAAITKYGTEIPDGYKWGVNFAEIERFIKKKFAGKIGCLRTWEDESSEDKDLHLLGFASQADYEAWLENPELVTPITDIIIPKGGGAESADPYIARVATSADATSRIVTTEQSHTVGIRFTSLVYEGGEYVDSGLPGVLTILRSIDGGATFVEVGQASILSHNENSQTFDDYDVGRYMLDGYTNILAVRASFRVGSTTYVSRQVAVATVVFTSLHLECMSDWSMPILSADVDEFGFQLRYKPTCAVEATLHITIKGTGSKSTVTEQTVTPDMSGITQSYSILDMNGSGLASHGVREVTAYLTCDDGSGNTLRGNTLVNRFMVYDSESGDTTPYIMLQDVINKVDNFVQARIFGYAVFRPQIDFGVLSPGNAPVPLAISVTSSATHGSGTSYIPETIHNAVPGTQYDYNAAIEIETESSTTSAYLHIWSGDANIMSASGYGNYLRITVDNSQGYTPTAGATFVLNPRLRNNEEEMPKTIINSKTGELIESTWQNFGLGSNDGWVKSSDGQRVLRVLAGQRLNFRFNPFARLTVAPRSSMTLEFDIKVYNITDEDAPIVDITENVSGLLRGLRLRPMVGNLYTQSQPNDEETNFRWQEGVRTHIAINIHDSVQTDINGDGLVTDEYYESQGRPATTRMFARVFINGDIEREILLEGTNAAEFCTGLMTNGGITIGQDDADIDIYSIRCYENNAMDAQAIVRDYIATLPTTEEKYAVRRANAIISGGRVDIEKVKGLGKRVLVLHGKEPFKYDTTASGNWWEIHQYDSDGNEIPELSGTICRATGFKEVKRQGSTANTYYYSNLQTKVSDGQGTIEVALADIHESITVGEPYERDGVMVVDIYGGNLGKKDPVAAKAVSYPYNNGYVTLPDGWIDGNNKYRGKGFMIAENTPLADKLVLKVNYASSMQSHVVGGTRLYNDLHLAVVGPNSLQKDVPTARVSKYTEPVFFFTQRDDTSVPVFRGMGNFGAGKMDKPTWGYVKSEHPMFAMVEGSDNDLALTDMRVPFTTDSGCPERITYDADEEGWFYNGAQCLDFDGGLTDDNDVPVAAITDRLAETWNWIYLHAPNLRCFHGNFRDFIRSTVKDTKCKYWCTEGTTGYPAYRLYRYSAVGDEWVNAGLWNGSGYDVVDLTSATAGAATAALINMAAVAAAYDAALEPEAQNAAFIASIAEDAKKYIGWYFNVDSLKFHVAFQNNFMAGTDNCSKNTYFVIDPSARSVTIDGETRECYLWELHQDDVDTILITDNNGRSTKPYYIDRMHPFADDNPSVSCYMGGANQLFNLCEAMWEREGDGSELADMMRRIFNAMVGLVSDADVVNGYSKTLFGCMQKYLLYSQHYFPQMAYNEQARIRYEFPATLGYISDGKGGRSIPPITQSMGSQLQAETQYIKRRLLYMASYAAWGQFRGDNSYSIGVADANGSFGFQPDLDPDGNRTPYRFTLVPHIYLYPSGAVGQTAFTPRHRVAPGAAYVLNLGLSGDDTGVSVFAAHLYRSLGNVGDMSAKASNTAIVTGNRLVEFKAVPSKTYTLLDGRVVGAYRPNSIVFSAPLIKTLSLLNSGIGGTLDVRTLTRLETLNLVGTYITELMLPTTNTLTDVSLPGTLTSLTIDGQPNLSNLTIEGIDSLETLRVIGNTTVNAAVRDILDEAWGNGSEPASVALSSLALRGVDWVVGTTFLKGLLTVDQVDITGTVTVSGTVDVNLAMRVMAKFPAGSGLTVNYANTVPITSAQVVLDVWGVSSRYIDKAGRYPMTIKVGPDAGNDIRSVEWDVKLGEVNEDLEITSPASGLATIDEDGVLDVARLNDAGDTTGITVIARVVTATREIVATFVTHLYYREAEVGDYVFADGTWSDTDDGIKTVVGRCFYVGAVHNEVVDGEVVSVRDRRMAAVKRLSNLASLSITPTITNATAWGPYPNDDGVRDFSDTNVYNTPVDNYANKSNTINETNYGVDGENITDSTSALYFIPAFALTESGDGILDVPNGTYVTKGRQNTLRIIKLRNDVLPLVEEDVPQKDGTVSEFDAVSALMNRLKIGSQAGSRLELLAFPAASYCYAYEPTAAEGLADRFKSHNWYLGDSAEIARLCYLTNVKSVSPFGDWKPLAFANDNARSGFATSTEGTGNSLYVLVRQWGSTYYMNAGYVSPYAFNQYGNAEKVQPLNILPICQF